GRGGLLHFGPKFHHFLGVEIAPGWAVAALNFGSLPSLRPVTGALSGLLGPRLARTWTTRYDAFLGANLFAWSEFRALLFAVPIFALGPLFLFQELARVHYDLVPFFQAGFDLSHGVVLQADLDLVRFRFAAFAFHKDNGILPLLLRNRLDGDKQVWFVQAV